MADASDYITEYPSPTGKYLVRTFAMEMKMSHWVYMPAVFERDADEPIVQVVGSWSADRIDWPSAETVAMSARRYPGRGGTHTVTIDCDARTFVLDGAAPQHLDTLNAAMDALV